MKDHIENWIGFISGTTGGGLSVTLLSIDLSRLEGVIYFMLSSLFAGLVGIIGKKTGELLWNKFINKSKKTNETIHSINTERERDGDIE